MFVRAAAGVGESGGGKIGEKSRERYAGGCDFEMREKEMIGGFVGLEE
jgi:hypothetical protein